MTYSFHRLTRAGRKEIVLKLKDPFAHIFFTLSNFPICRFFGFILPFLCFLQYQHTLCKKMSKGPIFNPFLILNRLLHFQA